MQPADRVRRFRLRRGRARRRVVRTQEGRGGC